MSHRGPFMLPRLLFALLLIGVLIIGGQGLFRSGLAQGFAQGYAQGLYYGHAASGSAPAPVPPVAPGSPYGYMPYGSFPGYNPGFGPFGGFGGGGLHFPLIGLLFCGGFLFLLLFVVGGAARRHMWKQGMAGNGPQGGQPGDQGPWGPEWWGHGHGPWSRPEEAPQAKQPGSQPESNETSEQKPM